MFRTLLLLAAISAPPDLPPAVTVVRVVDGDTVVCEGDDGKRVSVRLLGVDTPETRHPQKGKEPFGPEASAYTKSRLLDQTVCLVPDTISKDADRYGRKLRWVFLAETGELFNETLVKEGFGRAYTEFPVDPVMSTKLRLLERSAKAKSLGLWGLETPPPATTEAVAPPERRPRRAG